MREVATEFGDRVLLNEFPAHEPGICRGHSSLRSVLDRCGLSRGIYVNGKEIFWGYEAPREGVREAVGGA